MDTTGPVVPSETPPKVGGAKKSDTSMPEGQGSSAPSGSGLRSLQLPPSEGNVATASASALAAAAVKAKVTGRRRERRRKAGREGIMKVLSTYSILPVWKNARSSPW